MTTYFQHVGQAGGQRDFPRTIGTAFSGLKQFAYDDIAHQLDTLTQLERDRVRSEAAQISPEGFQIWGIPSGAKSVLRSFSTGDYLLLLENIGDYGKFAYAGRAVSVLPRECYDLSRFLWGEDKFPLIALLKGDLTDFSWTRFCNDFGYKPHWNPAGQTYQVLEERILASPYETEDELIRAFIGRTIELGAAALIDDDAFFEPAEVDFADEEGRKLLRLHVVRERSAALVKKFKASLSSLACSVCDFDFGRAYGAIGRDYVEAHHTKPVQNLEPGEKVSIADLVPVCSNCHRMLHRRCPPLEIGELKKIMAEAYERQHD